jgi:hypothetical protein
MDNAHKHNICNISWVGESGHTASTGNGFICIAFYDILNNSKQIAMNVLVITENELERE